jgi:transposase
LSLCGTIDLYYGDESHVCSEGYVPYGWQFPDEEVCIRSEKAYKVNCLGFITRENQCRWKMTTENVDTQFILEYLEQMSFEIQKITFVVLDNAKIHKTKAIKERIPYWLERGLYIFYLPPYCPHLNIAETLWRKLKKEWLDPEDYLEKDKLFYAINRCLANVGINLKINFSHFNIN